MRRGLTALTAAVVLAAVPLAGCGKDEPGIPSDDASQLIRLLRETRELADDPRRCDDLQDSVRRVAARVRALPDKTDSDVRQTLRNGVRNLASLTRAQCREEKPDKPKTNTETTPDTVPTAPPETTPPETSPPETTPPETTPPETTPPETTPPPPPVPTTPGTGGQGPGNNGNGFGNGNRKPGKKDKDRGKKR